MIKPQDATRQSGLAETADALMRAVQNRMRRVLLVSQ